MWCRINPTLNKTREKYKKKMFTDQFIASKYGRFGCFWPNTQDIKYWNLISGPICSELPTRLKIGLRVVFKYAEHFFRMQKPSSPSLGRTGVLKNDVMVRNSGSEIRVPKVDFMTDYGNPNVIDFVPASFNINADCK